MSKAPTRFEYIADALPDEVLEGAINRMAELVVKYFGRDSNTPDIEQARDAVKLQAGHIRKV